MLTPAHAQMPPAPSFTGMDHLARIVAGTPGLPGYMVSGVNDGVTLRTTGNVLVGAPSGVRIPVPITAQATISKAAMAKAAAKFVARSTLIGAPFMAYDTYNWLKNEGMFPTCANNAAMFCTPATQASPYPYIWRETQQTSKQGTTPEAACMAANSLLSGGLAPYGTNQYGPTYTCRFANGSSSGYIVQQIGMCQSGYVLQGSNPATCVSDGTGLQEGQPVTEQEVITKLTGTNWDPLRSKKMHDALVADRARSPDVINDEDLKPPASPLDWETPAPVLSPPAVTKEETINNTDGTTSTRRTTSQEKVETEKPAPSSIGTPASPTFRNSTISTTTITNNTTNVTTTESTTTTNHAPAQAAPQEVKIPTDYAREPTLQAIAKQLTGDGAKEMPDQTAVIDAAKKDVDDKLKAARDAIPGAQEGEDKARFFSWVWTAPVGSCVPTPAVSTSAGVVRWDICPTVNNIRDLMGWLFGMFGAIMIYNQIFRNND